MESGKLKMENDGPSEHDSPLEFPAFHFPFSIFHSKRLKSAETESIVALAGNPNVGKSTIFNALTGLHQHTGNWPGKTVVDARGFFRRGNQRYALVDLPGCYSLFARSAEEEVARDFLCFGRSDATVVVCDAACLERNLILVLQTLELTGRVVVCVNLMDEAKKRRISVDVDALSAQLGVPAVGTAARSKRGLDALTHSIQEVSLAPEHAAKPLVAYPAYLEQAVAALEPVVREAAGKTLPARWLALRLLEEDTSSLDSLRAHIGIDLLADERVAASLHSLRKQLEANGITTKRLCDNIASAVVHTAETICRGVVRIQNPAYAERDRRIDRLLTSRCTGFPVMFLALLAVLWLTLAGSNAPSEVLGRWLFALEQPLRQLLGWIGTPDWLGEMLCAGTYRVLVWVVSVMLPPMAIFFPLFTLLEDAGYLPRVAFNLDKLFHHCGACGKQALTMCSALFRLSLMAVQGQDT